jgi:hypothetical protein
LLLLLRQQHWHCVRLHSTDGADILVVLQGLQEITSLVHLLQVLQQQQQQQDKRAADGDNLATYA